ncbi:MAG TPA: hypothetical protein VN922_09665, partial [Bacteroidia bacterium]|nr:hypothetical protein [Bacteroidia bacterium]
MQKNQLFKRFVSLLNRLFFPSTSNWKHWLLIAILIRGLFFVAQLYVYRSTNGIWGITSDDDEQYLTSIENLITKGSYTPDFRMPGYGAIYFPLFLFFSRITSYNLLILLQLLASSLSVYALALIAKKVFNNNILFFITFYLFAICYLTSSFDIWLLTESFTTSALIFFLYYFISYYENKNKRYLFLAGLFITWVIFLRPVYMPVPFILLPVLYYFNQKDKKKFLFTSCLFLSTFVVTESAWVVRNYIVYKEVIPLTKSVYLPTYEDTYVPTESFVQAWGGGVARDYLTLDFSGAPDIYTSRFNADSLKALHELKLKDITISPAEKALNHQLIIKKINLYTQSIKQERPWLYYIQAPLSQAKQFFSMSRIWYIFFFIKNCGKQVWYFYTFFYNFILYTGFLGMLLLLLKLTKEPLKFLLVIIPLYTIVIHP